jgi:hypothetical protein
VLGRVEARGLLKASAVLTPGRDYLFFEKVDCTQQSLITTMTRGAVVLTPNLIAVIPKESMGSVLVAAIATRYDGDALRFVKALLDDPAVDVAKLENALGSMYSGSHSRWVFPIAELETLKVTTGFFGMISLKMPRESVRRLVIRDKGGKAAAKTFLDALTRERAAS